MNGNISNYFRIANIENILFLLQLRKYMIQESYIIIGPVAETDYYQFSQERLIIKIIFTSGEARIYRNIYDEKIITRGEYITNINNIECWKLEFTTELNSIF